MKTGFFDIFGDEIGENDILQFTDDMGHTKLAYISLFEDGYYCISGGLYIPLDEMAACYDPIICRGERLT